MAGQTRIAPIPKGLCVAGDRIRTLATAKQGAVLTDLDAATFAVRDQMRGLPSIHKLLLTPDGYSLGYTQRSAKGHPSEIHFVDPALRLIRTVCPADACTGFAHRQEQWIVACRDGAIRGFSRTGEMVWTWCVPAGRHFDSPVFDVVATDELIFAAEGLFLYALTPQGRLLWDWELPNRHEQVHRLRVPFGGTGVANQAALRVLGLGTGATPEEVRRAYRRMARLTHPDFNPGDASASGRFRAVRGAYQALQGEAPDGDGNGTYEVTVSFMIGGRPVTARITALQARGPAIAVGTSEGEVYLCDLDGEVLAYHEQLGHQCVASVLLKNGKLDAAFCWPHVYRFGGAARSVSSEMPEFGTRLVSHGGDVLAVGWKMLWLLDGQARLTAEMAVGRKIDGVCASATESIVLAGMLFSIPHA